MENRGWVKNISVVVGFFWPEACHIWLHFCLLVTFKTLKNHKSYFAEVGIINRPGFWSLFMTQPPPPLHSAWQRCKTWNLSLSFHSQNKMRWRWHFSFCIDLSRQLWNSLRHDGLSQRYPKIQLPAMIPKSQRRVRNVQQSRLWIPAHLLGLGSSQSTGNLTCPPGGPQARLFSEVYSVTMPPLGSWKKIISFTSISSKQDAHPTGK